MSESPTAESVPHMQDRTCLSVFGRSGPKFAGLMQMESHFVNHQPAYQADSCLPLRYLLDTSFQLFPFLWLRVGGLFPINSFSPKPFQALFCTQSGFSCIECKVYKLLEQPLTFLVLRCVSLKPMPVQLAVRYPRWEAPSEMDFLRVA